METLETLRTDIEALRNHATALTEFVNAQADHIAKLTNLIDLMAHKSPSAAKTNVRVLAPHDEFVRVRTEMIERGLKPTNEEVRIEWLRTREARPSMQPA